MKATLGLTGLTMNAMALIAPGAFLWLTFAQQSLYGAPLAGQAIWFGILAAIALCFATAIAYAELSKLYPGAGSSYFFAEQAFLSKTHAYKFARLAKFIIGWASHLYYWVYPGLMVGVTAILVGWWGSQFRPDLFNSAINSPTLMIGFCVLFSFGVSYIAYRGVVGSTGVSIAINVIQITALMIFAFIAIGYRMSHPDGSSGFQISNSPVFGNVAVDYVVKQEPDLDDNNKPVPDVGADGKAKEEEAKDDKGMSIPEVDAEGKPKVDEKGQPVLKMQPVYKMHDAFDEKTGLPVKDLGDDGKPKPLKLDYIKKDDKGNSTGESLGITQADDASNPKGDKIATFQFHDDAKSVVAPHSFSFVIVQACIAILILVGFESVTSMGEEAKNAKRDIPRAVLLSLFIQGVICYLIEYFGASYFLNPAYKMTQAAGSSAPIGDMMLITGTALLGSAKAGWWFMFIMSTTVFLALIGTTLSCMNTAARVTYAMGRDDEVPSHFGMLHGKNLTPHRAIWTLACVSTVIGIITVLTYLCGEFAADSLPTALTSAQKGSLWYPNFLLFWVDSAKSFPNSFLVVTLCSNFGTFMLYGLTCYIAIVAFRDHHTFSGFKHMVVPVFGLLANLLCMVFYLVGPFVVPNMSKVEPFVALGVAAVWGAYGAMYFVMASKKKGRSTMVGADAKAAMIR